MNKKFKRTNALMGVIDDKLLKIIEQDCVASFRNFMNNILKELNIEIHEESPKEGLAVRCNDDNYYGYKTVTHIWFYLRKLERLEYITYINTATQSKEIKLGSSIGTQNSYLSKEISDFIKTNICLNIVVSPELKEYIEADHVSMELNEARKSTRYARNSLIFAVISALVAVLSLILSCSKIIVACNNITLT